MKLKQLFIQLGVILLLAVLAVVVVGGYTRVIYRAGKEHGRLELMLELEEQARERKEENEERKDKAEEAEKVRTVYVTKYVERTKDEFASVAKDHSGCTVSDDFVRMWNQDNQCILRGESCPEQRSN
jgi:hypothetical protein